MKAEEIGYALIFLGFFIAFAATAILIFSSLSGRASFAGCIAIPIPICFGVGPEAPLLIAVSLLVLLILLVATLLFLKYLLREASHYYPEGTRT